MMEQTVVGFVGLGLIGGSVARALKKSSPATKIIAFDPHAESLSYALNEGIIDIACNQLDTSFSECDYLFLCAPVAINIRYLKQLKALMKPTALLTDVGSVKTGIHEEICRLDMTNCFIGGHPMAGSEKSGIASSSDHLLENAYYVLTPSENVSLDHISNLMALVTSLGAIPMVLSYEEHDYITAAVSHLPHVIASTLVNLIQKLDSPNEYMKTIAAGGFKDITRIASSSPEMWRQICLTNQKNISKVLDEYIKYLIQIRVSLDNSSSEELYHLFESAREYRNALPNTSNGPIKKIYLIYCDIIDEAGGIATIATILACNGISIKNIGIVHNREFEEGVLKIEFYDEDAYDKAAIVLENNRYTVYKR